MLLVTVMAIVANRRRLPGVRPSVASCLIATLLTPVCVVSTPRAALPQTVSPVEREECEGTARQAEAQVRGSSVGGGAAIGAAGGVITGAFLAARGVSSSESDLSSGDAVLLGALVGGVVVVGALIGGATAAVRNASLRRAAHAETMDACLRPAILSAALGPEHPEVASSLHALGFRYYRLGELARAEPLLARALAIRETHFGMDAPELATILDDYAALLRRTGRAAEGEALEQRARTIRSAQ
jgi:hypothetical protein